MGLSDSEAVRLAIKEFIWKRPKEYMAGWMLSIHVQATLRQV